MRRFLIKIIPYAIFATLLLLVGAFLKPQLKNTYLFGLDIKYQSIKEKSSPKIVLVGGSNVAFGMDSKMLEERLKMPVVNFGLHAGLGLRFMIEDVEPFLNSGDIVILSPEYHIFLQDRYEGSYTLAKLVTEYYPEKLRELSFSQVTFLRNDLLRIYHDRLVSQFVSNNEIFKKDKTIYSSDSFNDNGDVIAHWNISNSKVRSEEKKKLLNLEKDLYDKPFEELSEFRNRLSKRNIKLILVPPPLPEKYFDVLEGLIMAIEQKLKSHNMIFVIDPECFKFKEELFFDTIYHLNKRGIDIRMTYLIELLEVPIKNQY